MKQKRSAVEAAMLMLGRRDYSEQEMQQKLTLKGYEDAEIQSTLARLKDLEYLDDAKYARHFVSDKARLAGWGVLRIRQSLKQKGVAEKAVDAALAKFEEKIQKKDEPTWTERATDLLGRRYGLTEGVLPPNEYRKRISFLLRRGFDFDQAKQALNNLKILAQEEEF